MSYLNDLSMWLTSIVSFEDSNDTIEILSNNMETRYCHIQRLESIAPAISTILHCGANTRTIFLLSWQQCDIFPVLSLQNSIEVVQLKHFVLEIDTMISYHPVLDDRVQLPIGDEEKLVILDFMFEHNPLLQSLSFYIPIHTVDTVAAMWIDGRIAASACITSSNLLYIHRSHSTSCADMVNVLTNVIYEWKHAPSNDLDLDVILHLVFDASDHTLLDAVLAIPMTPHASNTLYDSEGGFVAVKLAPLDSQSGGLQIPTSSRSSSDTCPQTTTEEIFLLLGQSNMSGRGDPFEILDDAMNIVDPMFEEMFEVSAENCVKLRAPYSNKVKYFNVAESTWDEIRDVRDIHRSVDVLKPAGIGPGIAFAKRYLDRCTDDNVSVGLVPCAVGATSSTEWMPNYLPIRTISPSTDTPSPTIPPTDSFHSILVKPNPNSTYQKGCVNLFSCAMRSLYRALLQTSQETSHLVEDDIGQLLSIRGLVKGALWYQGCNDAIPETPLADSGSAEAMTGLASDYGSRLRTIIAAIRKFVDVVAVMVHLTSKSKNELFNIDPDIIGNYLAALASDTPSLATAVVAITTTRPWLSGLAAVRSSQFSISNAINGIANVCTVDAMGGMLCGDCVHLTTGGVVALGGLLGDAMYNLLNCEPIDSFLHENCVNQSSVSCCLGTIQACNCQSWDITRRSLPCGFCILEKLFVSAHTNAEKILDEKYAAPVVVSSLSSREKKPLPILHTSLKHVNFVYGEITFAGISLILHDVLHCISRDEKKVATGLRFLDLGCGSGVALAAAVLTGKFDFVGGVDLMTSKLETCEHMLHQLEQEAKAYNALNGSTIYQCPRSPSGQASNYPIMKLLTQQWPKIDIKLGNFLECDVVNEHEWSSLDVIYVCSTCFADDRMESLYQKFQSLVKVGSYVILLDKEMKKSMVRDQSTHMTKDMGSSFGTFDVARSCECKTSWGIAKVYVYKKIRDDTL